MLLEFLGCEILDVFIEMLFWEGAILFVSYGVEFFWLGDFEDFFFSVIFNFFTGFVLDIFFTTPLDASPECSE